ncbi:hypothetical protein BJV74DRAFT_868117 [Russula compacta]|nr:hypothetical protein BJV74DRAFT_868117 [Russula compacta]
MNVYIRTIESIKVDLWHGTKEAGQILIDSGATDNCIHPALAERMGMQTHVIDMSTQG